MSEGAAGRRVTAARVCRRFPEVFERVAQGELHLCALCALAPHLNNENSAELFEVCGGKTRRQVEQLLAARFPRPDVREQIRRLPVRARRGVAPIEENVLPSRASDAFSSPSMPPETTAISRDPVPLPAVPLPAVPLVSDPRRRARELEPLSADRFGVHFTADAELRDLIERARALASHRLPNGDLAGLMKLMAVCFVRQEQKRRFGIGARPRRLKAEAAPALSTGQDAPPGGVGTRARYVPVTVRRETHTRRWAVRVRLSRRSALQRSNVSRARSSRTVCKAGRVRRAEHPLAVQGAQPIACSKLLRQAARCRENRRQ